MFFKFKGLVDLQKSWIIIIQCSAIDKLGTWNFEFSFQAWFYVWEKNSELLFLHIQQEAITRNSPDREFGVSEDTKLLLSLWVDVIYTNLVYP